MTDWGWLIVTIAIIGLLSAYNFVKEWMTTRGINARLKNLESTSKEVHEMAGMLKVVAQDTHMIKQHFIDKDSNKDSNKEKDNK